MIYEATILLSPQLGSEKTLPLWERLNKEIESAGGKIEKTVGPFEKNLAYSIKKNGIKINRAQMGIIYISPSQEPAVFTSALSEFLKAQDSILRFMVSRFLTIPEQRTRIPRQIKPQDRGLTSFETDSKLEEKNEKPVKEEIDKKIEEILEDKISF